MKKLLPISTRMFTVGFLMLLFLSVQARAQSVSDADLIKQTALDYIEGWYEGNAERMERALHPELAKRIVRSDAKSGRSMLGQMSAMTLVQGVASDWIDYLHMAKWNERWVIVNVLWELKPPKK